MSKIFFCCCNIGFVPIYVLLWQICFVAIYALLCGEKIIKKLHMWRKNDKYQVCNTLCVYFYAVCNSVYFYTEYNNTSDIPVSNHFRVHCKKITLSQKKNTLALLLMLATNFRYAPVSWLVTFSDNY